MKKTFFTAWLAFICLFCSAQGPDSLTGPRLWLSADRSALSASHWSDLSFYKNHAMASNPAAMPLSYDTINFNPSLSFDGVDDYLKISYNFENLAELTVLTVFSNADTTERGIWGTEESFLRTVLLTTKRAMGPDSVADMYAGSQKLAILNSLLQNWDKASIDVTASSLALGSAGITKPYQPFKGSIAEMLVFNRALTFLERIQYETYLAIKYGTGLGAGNFVSSNEEVLWKVSENTAFGKNIAGIGRDDWFNLNQKQSGSTYDSGLLVVSLGSLKPSNAENDAIIDDGNFILWGDNAMPLTTRPGTGPDSLLSFLERKWLVTVTGNTASQLQTSLYIDANRFPADPLGYWLVIDRSGQANFSIDNLEYILADRIENGKVIFNDVQWDTDGSGKDNFGFAREKNFFAVLRKLQDPSCTNPNAGEVQVEVVKGTAPFQLSLKSADGKPLGESKEHQPTSVLTGLTEGNFTLTMKDDNGETIARAMTLTMPDALRIDLGTDQMLSATNPIILDVTSQIPDSIEVSYEWANSFGFSSTDSVITVTESGIYTLTVTKAADGCQFSDQTTISGADQQRVAVFPTLVSIHDTYNVSVSLPEAGPVAVKVFNMQGVMRKGIEGTGTSEYHFSTQVEQPGLYLVVIQTSSGSETRKIIVH